jgi:hypothetical protein
VEVAAAATVAEPVRVARQHALQQRAIVRAPQRLAGGAVVARDVPDRGQQRRHQLGDQPVPAHRRDVGHVGGIGGQAGEVVVPELLGAEGPLTERGHGGRALIGRQIGQVTRWQHTPGAFAPTRTCLCGRRWSVLAERCQVRARWLVLSWLLSVLG